MAPIKKPPASAKRPKAGDDHFEGDAHALLMKIYRDTNHDVALRLEAAKAALRFEKPIMAAIDIRSESVNTHIVVSEKMMSDEEWEAAYCADTQH